MDRQFTAAPTGPAAIIERVSRICDAALAAVGYELVELEYRREPVGQVLRLYIDHPAESERAERSGPQRRITHEDCERASRHVSAVLDVEDPIGSAYALEVSSPGVYRPLRQERDFRRFAGFKAALVLRAPLQGRRKLAGELAGAAEGVVKLLEGEREWQVPLEMVQKAQLTEPY